IGTVRDEGCGGGCEIGGRAGNKGQGGCRKSGRDTVGGKERKGVQRRRILRPVADVAVVILLRFQLDLLILAGNLQRHRAEIMINPSLQRQFAGEILGGEGGFNFSGVARRSEEHTSELQSLMRSSYAVFCLKKK